MNTRRSFIQQATAGLGSSLAFGNSLMGATPTFKPTANSVIMLYISGGMSHIDSLDPKPENKEIQGDTGVIGTNVDGIQVGQHLSNLAKQMDKCCIIRSMSTTQGAHTQGRYYQHTSYTMRGTIQHPSIGTWISRMTGSESNNLPASVVINEINQGVASSAGFMESKYAAVPIGDPEEGLPNLDLPDDIDKSRQDNRLSLALQMNYHFAKRVNLKNVRSYSDAYINALRLMKHEDRKAFSIKDEPSYIKEMYGDSEIGKGCLLARRLVEHGVRFVEVMNSGWDDHTQIQNTFPKNCSYLDQGLSALIKDLNDRGMLDDTLVVLCTEFGRSPKINVNAGRDHHPLAYSHLLAGGGVRGGQVYGASDQNGAEVTKNKVTPIDFNATIGHALGIDLDEIIMSPSGRPFQFAHKGKPITEIFS